MEVSITKLDEIDRSEKLFPLILNSQRPQYATRHFGHALHELSMDHVLQLCKFAGISFLKTTQCC